MIQLFLMMRRMTHQLRLMHDYSKILPTSMLAMHEKVKCLPVRPLEETFDRYLVSVRQVLDKNDFTRLSDLITDMKKPDHPVNDLQKFLVHRSQSMDSWLADYWVEAAYLAYRSSVVINSNPGIAIKHKKFKSEGERLKYASSITASIVHHFTHLYQRELKQEYLKEVPLCMEQYYKIFACCRQPASSVDKFNMFAFSQPRHISVLYKNHIFDVFVRDVDGSPYSPLDIFNQLRQVINEGDKHGNAPSVSLFTAANRDVAFNLFDRLNAIHGNSEIIKQIQSSIFLLCLDDVSVDSEDLSAWASHALHGGGSSVSSCNRWFDKTIQLFLTLNGLVGFNYEHTSAEGGVPVGVILSAINARHKVPFGDANTAGVPDIVHHKFNVTPDLMDDINRVGETLDSEISQLQMKVKKFDLFGKNFIKQCKLSPDAFFQVAIQLAYYRLYNKMVPTYESCSIRSFRHGRTETIRSTTPHCLKFLLSFKADASKSDQRELLCKAARAHSLYASDASQFHGVDRHLLGLQLAARDLNVPVPSFFSDPAFKYTFGFKISTSQVPAGSSGVLTFGPVVEDGYGVCYNPQPTSYIYSVTSFRTCASTDSDRMSQAISQSLTDMMEIMSSPPLKSKL
uniref:Choline acetyltransferase n=1 Tax=Hofstenia miamia TaxID=442651 RepID=A0A7G7LK67_HOFMI|nr:choline acetyltransferase [Hofstenia miamia]